MTKNIVPRAAGEGSLGIAAKPWGVVYADSIPLAEEKITNHDNLSNAHANGISGNAATASRLLNPVLINGIPFDGTQNIEIAVRPADAMTASEAKDVFDGVYDDSVDKVVTEEALTQVITSMKEAFLTDKEVTNAIIEKKQGITTLERDTTYTVGEAVYSHKLLKGLYLECIQTGKTNPTTALDL